MARDYDRTWGQRTILKTYPISTIQFELLTQIDDKIFPKKNYSWSCNFFFYLKKSKLCPPKTSAPVLSLLPFHLLCQNFVPNGGDESSSKSCIMHYCILRLFISPSYLSFSKSWKKECVAKFSKYSFAMIFISIFSLELINPCAIHKRTNWSLEKR